MRYHRVEGHGSWYQKGFDLEHTGRQGREGINACVLCFVLMGEQI